jgi:hypothetical protein
LVPSHETSAAEHKRGPQRLKPEFEGRLFGTIKEVAERLVVGTKCDHWG